MKLWITTLTCIAALACPGCSEPSEAEHTDEHAEHEDEHTHGAVGARPGSWADWCGEHQVPESQCTRCNPSLIPAFKATGDWCEEHQLPHSQCRICNPDLQIERPPREG